jgi:tetratricopeptide (TPR) repeat protein
MRGRRIQAGAVVIGLVLGLCPGNTSVAWAQAKGSNKAGGAKPAPTATDPSTAEFEKHFAAGQAAAKANRWDAARQEFLQAFDLRPDHAGTVALLAQAEMATGRHREAAEHLDIFLEYAVALSPADRKTAEDLLIEAQSKLSIVTIKVDKPGAKITVDGRALGTSPLAEPVLVDAGPQRRFEAEGPDGRARVVVDLEPRTTPTINMVLTAPPTKVVEKQTWRTAAIVGGMTLSVVGVGVGVGFLVAATAKNKEATNLADEIRYQRNANEALCPPANAEKNCLDLAAAQSRRDTFGNVSLAGFIVGGAAAVGTLVLVITSPNKSADAKKKDAFRILPSPGGVLVTGTF